MRHPQFPYLFSPLRVGSTTVPNRIVFSAHLTNLAEHNLPGPDLLAYYEERSGHKVRHLHFYQVFAGWRFAIIMLRIAQQVVHYELATPEQGRELELNNTVTRLTAKLLELRAPGAGTSGDFSQGGRS